MCAREQDAAGDFGAQPAVGRFRHGILKALTTPSQNIFRFRLDKPKKIEYCGSVSKINRDTEAVANQIDDIDARILELLQERGRMKRNAVADEVGLSVSAVSERMRKLEDRGVIEGYCAIVDPKRLRFDITAFIRASVDGSEHYADFVDRIQKMGEVLELHSITGEGSHVMKIRTKNTTTLERFLSR